MIKIDKVILLSIGIIILILINITGCRFVRNDLLSIGEISDIKNLVVNLNISPIPPEDLWKRQDIKYLTFVGKGDAESIPDRFSNFHDLKELSFYVGNLRKIPESIWTLERLNYLDIDNNMVDSISTNIGNMKGLKKLKISRTWIKTLPESIAQLDSLEEVDLSGNQELRLRDVMPVLAKVPRLKKLIISDLKITELPKDIRGLKQLQVLVISSNRLRALPKEVGGLNNLEEINLSDNDIICIPYEITSLSKLRIINLHRNKNLDLQSMFSLLSKSKSKQFDMIILTECAITNIPEEIGLLEDLGRRSFYLIDFRRNFITALPKAMEKLPRTLVRLTDNPLPEETIQWFSKSQEKKNR